MGQTQSKEWAHKQLELLVKRFKNDLKNGVISCSHKLSLEISKTTESGKKYSESQVIQSYILPMFRDVLGWNTDDSVNEVIPELHNHEGFADFTFVRNGKRKFLLETKKPYVNVDPNSQSGRDAVRQAVGYSRSLKDVQITLVSNFEVLVFGHAFTMPKKGEEIKNTLHWFHFTDFCSNESFNLLWEFRFDRAGESDFGSSLLEKVDKKLVSQYKSIDENLLSDIKVLRVKIANCLKPKTMSLSNREETVQLLINRIIFLRSLEDRNIIANSIHELLPKTDLWKNFGKFLDGVYAKFPVGILNRKSGSPLDSNKVSIDDDEFRVILQMFYDRGPKYFHDCYDFKYIPSDILGYAYEHSIAYELKKDSKKNQFKLTKKLLYKNGVHYTPGYICTELSNSSVQRAKNNLGKSSNKLVCFDIACGSGSFLTSVYDSIYRDTLKNSKGKAVEGENMLVLDLKSRKSIIENCVYGIDIDYFAVQISKLCLYLKFFENFPISNLNKKCSQIPNLEQNIVFGDSLLDTTQNTKHPKGSMPIGEQNKKVFNLIKNKRIDVVVGNPPYIKIQDLKKISQLPEEHYKMLYSKTISKGSMEFAIGFVERTMTILTESGVLGYIIPNKIFRNKQGENLRGFISEPSNKSNLFEFIDFNSCQIFDASIYTCLLYLEKGVPKKQFKCGQIYELADPVTTLNEVRKVKSKYPSKHFEVDVLKNNELSKDPWNLMVGPKRDLFMKLRNTHSPLEEVAIENKIFQGIPTGSDKVYLMRKLSEKNSKVWVMESEGFKLIAEYEKTKKNNHSIKSSFEIEKKYLRPVVNGSKDLKPFYKGDSDTYLLFPYDDDGNLLTDKVFLASKAYSFLNQKEIKNGYKGEKKKTVLYGLNERENGRFSGKKFYQYSYPKNMKLWPKPKIMIPYIVERFNAHLDLDSKFFVNVSTGGYCILAPEDKKERTYLLGILNSRVFDFMVKCFSGDFRGGWIECNKHYIGKASVPKFVPDQVDDKQVDELEECLNELYKCAEAYYSKEQSSAYLRKLNTFYREAGWLDNWSKTAYSLSDDEYRLIEYYTTDQGLETAITDLQKVLIKSEKMPSIEEEPSLGTKSV